MDNSFYTTEELNKLGFKSFGKNVLISRFAHFYGIENIEIGNNVRIDDFCILSGNIKLGSNIHISAYSALYGRGGIEFGNYSGLSPRCTVFSLADDFGGDFLIGPTVPIEFTNVKFGKVTIGKYVQIGAGCVIFPGLQIAEGSAVGAMSLINKNIGPWGIYAGIPVRFIKQRKKGLLKILKENKF